MRHRKRRSQEDIENSFNAINLDYIFQEEDSLSPWLEEREAPLLNGIQNAEWLLLIDFDNEDSDSGNESLRESSTQSGSGEGLSLLSNNSGDIDNVETVSGNDSKDKYKSHDLY